MKYKICLSKGTLIGILTGLVVTISDSFFMLSDNKFFPTDYPFFLILFNVFAWALFGILSGTVMHFIINIKVLRDREKFLWIFVFLIPFAIIYFFLGQISSDIAGTNNSKNYSVFPLILIFFSLSVFNFKRKTALNPSFLLLPEIVFTVIILDLYANLKPFLFALPKFIANILVLFGNPYSDQKVYCLVLFSIMFTFVFCIYLLTVKKLPSKGQNPLPVIILVCFLALISLPVCFLMGQQKAKKRYYPPITKEILPEDNKVPYVFLIVLDTVRADSLSIYSGNPTLGLQLEQFAKDALVFENCIASSSWTLPSHASMFTGLYPREHGTHKHITKNKVFYPPIQLPTLADVFHENRYNTFAIVSNFGPLNARNFGKGFDIYDCAKGLGKSKIRSLNPLMNLFCYETNINPKYFSPYRTAEDINSSTQNLLANYHDSPFFLFLNFMDAHLPYFPPRTFDRLFTTSKLSLLYRIKYARSFFWDIQREFLNKSLYNSEIAYLDHQLGKLFAHLKKIGIYDKSLIVITSDHGELFNEHKVWGHKQSMYEGSIKVPLLVKFPYSLKTGREKKLFALSDLFSLILETCSLPLPEYFSKPKAQKDTSFVVSELYADEKVGVHRVIYDGRYKLMKYSKKKPIELYDLEKDPKERVNLAKELPKITEELLNKLTEWAQKHKPLYQEPQNKPVISEEFKNDMRALGYVE